MKCVVLHSLIRYEVFCEPQIETVLRVINMFSKRGLHPENVDITKRQNSYCVTLVIRNLEYHEATVIAENISALVLVHSIRHN